MALPVWWEFPEGKRTDTDDAAMLGPALFVAPFLSENDPLVVELPQAAHWFRCDTRAEVNGTNVTIRSTAVFVRGGAIVPFKRRTRKSSALMFWDPLSLVVAVSDDGKTVGEIYVDDGETFNFARGALIHRKFVFDGKVLKDIPGGPQAPGEFESNYDVTIEQIQIVGLNATPTAIVDSKGNAVQFSVIDGVVTIRRPNVLVSRATIPRRSEAAGMVRGRRQPVHGPGSRFRPAGGRARSRSPDHPARMAVRPAEAARGPAPSTG
jgi:alpha 1,3-glucosidase